MSNHLTVGNRTYDGFHVIQNADRTAGFSALITYGLNGARRAEAKNWLPVVCYDGKTTPHFYDPDHGENVWEYYFQPLAGVSYAQLEHWLAGGEVAPDLIHQYSDREIMDWHVNDPGRLATFWTKDVFTDRGQWLAEKRRLGREYVSRYIRLQPHIVDKVEHCCAALIRPRFTFGVHIRGTDFAYAAATYPTDYFQAITEKAEELGLADYAIFLATDQAQFVSAFEDAFPGRVVTYDAIRSVNDIPPFKLKDVRPYKKGEDVLLDILLLSRCQFLFKSVSAVGEYALWFNPSLECRDFALDGKLDIDHPALWTGAYLTMNVDNRGPIRVMVLTWVRIAQRIMERLRPKIMRVLVPWQKPTSQRGRRKS